MLLLLLLLWLPDFWSGSQSAGTFWIPLTGQFTDGNLLSGKLFKGLALFGLLLNAGALYVLGVRHAFFTQSLFSLPFFFMLFLSAFPQVRVFSPAWLSVFLLLLSLHHLFLSENNGGNGHVFTAAFLGTLAGLVYMPAWIMLVGLGLGLVIWHQMKIRPYIIFLSGILLPLAGLLLFRFFVYEDADVYLSLLSDAILQPVGEFPLRSASTLFLLLVFAYLSVRAVWTFLSMDSKLNVFRARVFSIFVWMLILCVLFLLFNARGAEGFMPLLALPVSVCLSFYFAHGRFTGRMKTEFVLLLLAIIMNQIQV
jgi:hypothetical protein